MYIKLLVRQAKEILFYFSMSMLSLYPEESLVFNRLGLNPLTHVVITADKLINNVWMCGEVYWFVDN